MRKPPRRPASRTLTASNIRTMRGDAEKSLAVQGVNCAVACRALVMGGHAVRYYGIDRNTIDFDFVTAVAAPEELRTRIPKIESLRGAREVTVWRSRDFARFEIGRLSDGREEFLEFWIRNHLLADFQSLKARSEIGLYGGEQVPFLSISDLMKSKETERESDWQDLALLEEIQDARHFAALAQAPDSLGHLLSNLRSRRGMDRAIQEHLVDRPAAVASAWGNCTQPVPYAFLAPLVSGIQIDMPAVPIEPAIGNSLASTPFGSAKHFALIEICRRAYKRRAMDIDRADKQSKLAEK